MVNIVSAIGETILARCNIAKNTNPANTDSRVLTGMVKFEQVSSSKIFRLLEFYMIDHVSKQVVGIRN